MVLRAGSVIGDIGNSNVISKTRQKALEVRFEESRQDKSRSCVKVVTCFAIQENE